MAAGLAEPVGFQEQSLTITQTSLGIPAAWGWSLQSIPVGSATVTVPK